MTLNLFMSMLGYVGAMYCIINDTVRRCTPETQGLVKATLWVICGLAGTALFASILRDAA
jgi:hypothetical protein